MKDPFVIDSPTCISFSGGRTSAYMLWRVLEANDGLPDDAVVCFANTGKEDPATLQFVQDCSANWKVPITWVEFRSRSQDPKIAIVDFDTASRDGEPFALLIADKNYLPGPMARFCTIEMKIKPMQEYLKSLNRGEWVNMVGIRADEPRRLAKILNNFDGANERIAPLGIAGIGAEDIGKFWKASHFDLQLPNINGKTYHGNCDLCFLKGVSQTISLIREKPERANWWIEQEHRIPALKGGGFLPFDRHRPSYQEMQRMALSHDDMFGYDEDVIACFCGD